MLFTYWKVLYLVLLRAKFRFSGWLVSVAEHAGLNLPEDRVSRVAAQLKGLNLRLVSEFVFINILLPPNVTCGSAVAQCMVECLTRDRGLRVRASSAALRYFIEQDTLVLAA